MALNKEPPPLPPPPPYQKALLQNMSLFQTICPGCFWTRDNRWLLSRVQRLAGLAGDRGLLSRLEAPTGTKGWHFIPVDGSNRDKRPAQPFVPVGGSNRDQRVPFYPGEDLQPGQIASPRTSSHPSILFNSHPPLSYLISSSPSPRGFPSLSILKLPASHPSPPSPGRVRPGAARRAARRASRRGWPGAAALRLGTQVAVVGQAPPPSVRRAGRHGLARCRRPQPGAQPGGARHGPASRSRRREPGVRTVVGEGGVSWPAGSSSSARPRWTRGQARPQRIQAVRSYRLDEFVFVNDLCL